MDHVSRLDHLSDASRGVACIFVFKHCFVDIRIKPLTQRFHTRDPDPAHGRHQLALRHFHANQQIFDDAVLFTRGLIHTAEGAAEVICNGQHITRKIRDGITRRILFVALGATANVLRFRHGAQ